MIERRALLGLGSLVVGATLAAPASACSLVATRSLRFDDLKCRRQIAGLAAVFNQPSLTAEAAESWLQDRQIAFGDELLNAGAERIDDAELLRTFRISDGKLDTKPLKVEGVELIRQRANMAAYALVVHRFRYFAADEEGCNGMFTHDESWGDERLAYLAAFRNNEMTSFRSFPEWFIDAG